MTARLWAIVPVKPFAEAKRRLAPLLSTAERRQLATVMFQDVLAALARAESLAGIVVVTIDPLAAAIATASGAAVLSDESAAGLNAALARALQRLRAAGCGCAVILPADVPAIEHADVEAIARMQRTQPAVGLVAASDGGTNALTCSPVDLITPDFGPGSFARHCDAVRAAGLAPQMLDLPRIALDIDRAEDAVALLARRTATRTHAYLTSLALEERLGLAVMAGGRA